MTLYNTNIAKDYAIKAGFSTAWSGVREILQNSLDGNDKGYNLSISHGKARDKSGRWALKVVNKGVTLTQDALVMGYSTKSGDDSQRGEHGEGLIVGINALVNTGHDVWIRTGNEVWEAKHKINKNGLELLVFDIRKQTKTVSDLTVEIKNITPEQWEQFQERLLFLENEKEQIEVSEGTILLNEKYQNKLFVKGIYVCELPNNYAFGYNLSIHLNRDREVAEPWSLRDKIRRTISQALQEDKLSTTEIGTILNKESYGESLAFSEDYWYDEFGLSKKLAEDFSKKHGKEAIPVCSLGDSQRVEHFGKKGITVTQAVKKIIEKYSGKLEEQLADSALDIKKEYDIGSIEDEDETDNICDIIRYVNGVEPGDYWNIIHIVDFVGDSIRGRADTKGEKLEAIYIAKRICNDKAELLRTFVHEVAHKYGSDGDCAHQENQFRILSEIIVNNI